LSMAYYMLPTEYQLVLQICCDITSGNVLLHVLCRFSKDI